MAETLTVDGVKASMQGRQALLAVWRRLNRRPRRTDAVRWLAEHIEKALLVSLRFADDLLYFWAGGEDKIGQNVVSDNEWATVRRRMLDKARETFTSANALLRTLTDTEEGRDGFALVHFVRPPGRRESIDIEPRDREWLAPLLLEAARLRPRPILRNLIYMVGDENVFAGLPETDRSTLLERIYKLNPGHVDTLFGSYAAQLLRMIADNDLGDNLAKSAAIQAHKRLSELP